MSTERLSDDGNNFDRSMIAMQQVRCSKCSREYKCTPWDDFYSNSAATDDSDIFIDGICEGCLLETNNMSKLEMPQLIDANSMLFAKAMDKQ